MKHVEVFLKYIGLIEYTIFFKTMIMIIWTYFFVMDVTDFNIFDLYLDMKPDHLLRLQHDVFSIKSSKYINMTKQLMSNMRHGDISIIDLLESQSITLTLKHTHTHTHIYLDKDRVRAYT